MDIAWVFSRFLSLCVLSFELCCNSLSFCRTVSQPVIAASSLILRLVYKKPSNAFFLRLSMTNVTSLFFLSSPVKDLPRPNPASTV